MCTFEFSNQKYKENAINKANDIKKLYSYACGINLFGDKLIIVGI